MPCRFIPLVLLGLLIPSFANAQNMDNAQLEKILHTVSDTVIGEPGAWEIIVENMPMLVVTDENNNRMRIISPIIEVKDMTPEQLQAAMDANFHSALDVKYATSSGLMWAAFIHPLKELQAHQVFDAVAQVYRAKRTFGTSYTSTDLFFPKKGEKPESDKAKKDAPKRQLQKS
ncbi:MAG: hypothetical protein AAF242_10090 [Bacteroidota bacterium]